MSDVQLIVRVELTLMGSLGDPASRREGNSRSIKVSRRAC
jgi:hypothetical protein